MGHVHTLFFVRHGETDWNVEGRLQGQRDIPLNDLGRSQAAEAGRKLLGLAASPDSLEFVASPMIRTRETMDILRRTAGLPVSGYRLDDRLREIAFGDWEGLTWREVRARAPVEARARDRDRWNYAAPGGESYAMLVERVSPVLSELTRDTVVVAHGGVARAVLNVACGLPKSEAPSLDIWQGRILVIRAGRFDWI
jgi:broad specificity phosphatase PhoE